MIAPNKVHLRTDPQRSVTEALVKKVAQNGPSGAPLTSVAMTPPKMPNRSAYTSNRPVTSISARNRGTTRFFTGSTPRTWSASSSSRILRAPRSAVIAVPATPASTIASTNGANSRIDASTKNPPRRSSAPRAESKQSRNGLTNPNRIAFDSGWAVVPSGRCGGDSADCARDRPPCAWRGGPGGLRRRAAPGRRRALRHVQRARAERVVPDAPAARGADADADDGAQHRARDGAERRRQRRRVLLRLAAARAGRSAAAGVDRPRRAARR